jgi:hypothetical protein
MYLPVHSAQVVNSKRLHRLIIRTTLYNLMTTIRAKAQADEDELAIATMVHLLQTRRVTHLGSFKYRQLVVQSCRAARHCRRKVDHHPSPPLGMNDVSTSSDGVAYGIKLMCRGETIKQKDAFPLNPT